MSDLMVTLVSLAWLVTAGGQTPAPKPNQPPQAAQGVAHQRNHAGDHARTAGQAPNRKVSDARKAADAAPVTAPGAKQRDYAGESNGSKLAPRPPS